MNSLDHLHHDTTDRIQLDTVSVDPNEEPPKNKKKKKKKKKKKTGAEAGTTDTSATDATTTTIDTTNTTTAKGETNAVTAASRYKCTACGKPASMKCPTCQKLGLPKGMSSFCSQKCFKENWSTHKALHKTMRGSNKKQSSATDGPVDLLAVPREFKHFEFTGDYRPAYVTPQKRCPSHIIGPDYSRHVQGVSASEKAARHQPPPERGSKELDVLRSVCVLGREIIDVAGKAVAAGVTGDELDTIVHEATIERGGYPSPLNYYCFPKSVCVSPNEVICHGIPNCRPLKNGDIVNLDVTIYKDGMHADLNETFLVGDVSDEHVELVKTAYKCLQEATNSVKPGELYKNLGTTIESCVKGTPFSVVRTYCGHGIGKLFHTAPNVPHYKKNRAKYSMKPGHTFTIEPMINGSKNWQDKTWPDNWTAVTADGSWSAQFEHTMAVVENGVEVMTAKPQWDGVRDHIPDWNREWFQR